MLSQVLIIDTTDCISSKKKEKHTLLPVLFVILLLSHFDFVFLK